MTTELANSSINLQLRAWAKTENMETVKNSLTAGILEAYTKEGIEIPFPQMDINIRGIKPREEIKLKEEIKPRENEKWIV